MSTILDASFCGNGWSEEYDCLPLRSRLNILQLNVVNQDHKSHTGIFRERKEVGDGFEKNLHTTNKSSTAVLAISGFPDNHASDSGSQIKSSDDVIADVRYPGGSDLDWTSRISSIYAGKGPSVEARVEVFSETNENDAVCTVVCEMSSDVADGIPHDSSVDSTGAFVKAAKVEDKIFNGFDDDLDNLVLGHRRRLLLSRKLVRSSGLCMMENNGLFPNSSNTIMKCGDIEKQDCDRVQDTPVANIICSLPSNYNHQEAKSSFVKVPYRKDPRPFDAMTGQVLPLLTTVKNEPVDLRELCTVGNKTKSPSVAEMQIVKTEPAFSDSFGDELDHLPLADRIKLLSGVSNMEMPSNLKSLKDDADGGPDVFDSFQSVSLRRPLKRKKTSTNSVETALEEDAPGLLKVLIERGILVDEIKLYGEEESDGDFDDFSGDGFEEFEAVISQMFQQRRPFLKFPLLHTKSGKISYCLACLLSLVEQTRYMLKRKWPVEWGWCRDLQSFVFVFHRHNRIVLERPEYGYATFFFELLDSVPVAWQIKRLVTAMKLTSCGRITLVENKPLVVGEDLSDGEARVLAAYGWTPNTGLGTMLNYCDRVYHDRRQERDCSEWRLRIGRQLMNGYNCGNIVPTNIPKTLAENQEFEEMQVKLEQ